ncbi:MAG TPA: hypothetical protein VJW51_07460 [Candidatus Acidoferrales bacterium]|nr:hypothetical protein [Candidatus Acidoferrales bacterium]
MKRVLATLPESFGLFLCLRERYLRGLSRKQLRFVDLWRMGALMTALPRFLAYREADAVLDGELPPYVADAHKFAAGVNGLMMLIAFWEALRGRGGGLPAMSVASLLKEADGLLVGDQEVCAAPPALIAEALRAYVAGTVSFKTAEPRIQTLLPDPDAFFAFASAFLDLKVVLWLLAIMRQGLVNSLLATFKNQQQRGGRGRSAAQAAFQSLTAALVPMSGASSSHPCALPMLDGVRSAILKTGRDKRLDLFHRLARKLISQSGEERTQLLAALRRAAAVLKQTGPVNPVHLDAIRSRWPQVNKAAARRCAAAWGQCVGFEGIALETLGALEANLRVPLGQPPLDAPLPRGIFSSVIGPSCAEALRDAFHLPSPQ